MSASFALRGAGFPRTAPAPGFPEFPIEQSLRCVDPSLHAALAREAGRRAPRDRDAWLVVDPRGACAIARTEGALRPLVGDLAARHGPRLVVGAPRVRYVHRPRLAEPWMRMQLSGPAVFLPPILADLARRKGRTLRLDEHGGPFALAAEAPLAHLLGYADWLADLCEGGVDLSMRLARYVPLQVPEGPDAA